MPKRKRDKRDEEDYDYLKKKLRKLERKIKSRRLKRRRDSSLSSVSESASRRKSEERDFIATEDDDVTAPDAGCSFWDCWPEPSEPSEVAAQAGAAESYGPLLPTAQPSATGAPLRPVAAASPRAAAAASPRPTPLPSVVVTSTHAEVPSPTADNVRPTVIAASTALQVTALPSSTAAATAGPAAVAVAAPTVASAAPGHQVADLQTEVPITTLDPDLLAILGDDPTAVKEYGEDIQNDLAIRLNHLATSGLSKENRKEIKDKYLIPGNCKMIKAPTLNPEIRASLIESQAKRDKGIENKQILTSCALTSLSKAITLILSSDNKNQEVLKLLMDTVRILGDIQHSDSILRRFFILSTVKKELKDQLEKTKIEDLLFGSNLAETLKSARTINKSGADMRAAPVTAKTNVPKPGPANKPLNSRAPPASRRPGPAGGARPARTTAPSAPTPRRPTTTRHSSRTSSRQPYPRPRR